MSKRKRYSTLYYDSHILNHRIIVAASVKKGSKKQKAFTAM
jgi:hypothetical protein